MTSLLCVAIPANRSLIIQKLVEMVGGSIREADGAGQEQAAAALANLARESEENRASIVVANGIPALLALLDTVASGKAKENAVGGITALCRNSQQNQQAVAQAGGIPKLVSVLLGFSNASAKDPSIAYLCTLAASAIKEMAKVCAAIPLNDLPPMCGHPTK